MIMLDLGGGLGVRADLYKGHRFPPSEYANHIAKAHPDLGLKATATVYLTDGTCMAAYITAEELATRLQAADHFVDQMIAERDQALRWAASAASQLTDAIKDGQEQAEFLRGASVKIRELEAQAAELGTLRRLILDLQAAAEVLHAKPAELAAHFRSLLGVPK